jgi:hypothetical protein
VQIPANADLRLASVQLLTSEAMPPAQDALIDLPSGADPGELPRLTARAKDWPMPLFRLPVGRSAEDLLAWRDALRARWPAALVVAAGALPQAVAPAPARNAWQWLGCLLYLLALARLAWRPVHGRWRPWIESAGCLLGPLWLVAGLHWGLRATPVGVAAFGGGLAYALAIERHHLARLWRLPEAGRDWLWPLAMLPVTAALIVLDGHGLRPQAGVHVLAYLGWAWLQQWLMLIVLLRRFAQITHRAGWAILALAGVLMQLCLVGELWWGWCFLRSRSVLPIALAHASCALLVEAGLAGGPLLRSLEVSARFFL